MTTLARHRTPGERRAHQSAQAAIARAWARAKPAAPPAPEDQALADAYPYVTPARARAIREEIQESRR